MDMMAIVLPLLHVSFHPSPIDGTFHFCSRNTTMKIIREQNCFEPSGSQFGECLAKNEAKGKKTGAEILRK